MAGKSVQGAEAQRLREDARAEELEAVGALPGRTPVGHGPRGLLAGRRLPGAISPTSTPAAAPIAGARTACWASPTGSAGSASRWPSGTTATRS